MASGSALANPQGSSLSYPTNSKSVDLKQVTAHRQTSEQIARYNRIVSSIVCDWKND
jgi:hypothetical protein